MVGYAIQIYKRTEDIHEVDGAGFKTLLRKNLVVYFDDIPIFCQHAEEYEQHLKGVLHALKNINFSLTLKSVTI